MSRRLWTIVAITVLVLGAAGGVPALWTLSGTVAWRPVVEAGAAWARVASEWIRTPAGTLAGVAALAWLWGVSCALSFRGARDRTGLVLREARRGRGTARVARRSRLAQDAVRTLLQPGRVGRGRRRREGSSGPEGLAVAYAGRPRAGSPGGPWIAAD